MADPTPPLGPDNPWVNPAAPPDVEPDSEPSPDNQRNPDTGEPNVWVEDPYGPDPPAGPPLEPGDGIDPDKSNPASPNYSPHFDPKVSNPEVPVPGLGVWPDGYVVDHSGDPNWVPPDYPDADAPTDPAVLARLTTEWMMFQTTVYLNGVAAYTLGNDSVAGIAKLVKGFLLNPPWGWDANPYPFVQLRTLGLATGQPVDVSGATPPAGWDGMVNVEVRVMAGFGDKL